MTVERTPTTSSTRLEALVPSRDSRRPGHPSLPPPVLLGVVEIWAAELRVRCRAWVLGVASVTAGVGSGAQAHSDPMDCSLTGSSVHGILQARVLEGVAIAFY